LQQPLAVNAVGWAAISGVTPAWINTTNNNMAAFCEVTNNNTVMLTAGIRGSAQILWTNTNASQPGLSMVRLGVPPDLFDGASIGAGLQSIPNVTSTYITGYTLDFDTGSYFNAGTPDYLTLQATGYYLIGTSWLWSAVATGDRYVSIYVGGTLLADDSRPGQNFTIIGSSGGSGTIWGLYHATGTGIQVKVLCWQNSGGNLSIDLRRLWAIWLGS
jgi:hypothetical protein